MGKLRSDPYGAHSQQCKDKDAPICGNTSCKGSSCGAVYSEETKEWPRQTTSTTTKHHIADNLNPGSNLNFHSDPKSEKYVGESELSSSSSIKDLLIVGAGPHALTLILRLLEADPDFQSEDTRHRRDKAMQMRPIQQVNRHVKCLSRVSRVSRLTNNAEKSKNKKNRKQKFSGMEIPPPLSLNNIQVVDAHGGWLTSWRQNFKAIGIPRLRSLMSAHADPYDHRSLEYYAETRGRGDELVTLEHLNKDIKNFRGPYQVPTTNLFHDFHDALITSYGIDNIVQKGKVLSITPVQDGDSDENIFEVQIYNGDCEEDTTIVRTRRCVCGLGPILSRKEIFWESDLRKVQGENYAHVSSRILRSDEIVRWLASSTNDKGKTNPSDRKRFLIVGGGITSVQLAIRAIKASWCESVVFIQRSEKLIRHFDVENEWMGPKRGKLLKEFFSMEMNDRVQSLKDARRGGSIPPELLKQLQRLEEKKSNLICKEEVEISQVDWVDEEFHVTLNDGTNVEVDYIWLSTGCANIIEGYPVLNNFCETLPINIINGLPSLSQDLSWSSNGDIAEKECKWMQLARKRFWCIGAMAGLQLGPDALNIVGARHGAVKVAKAIRSDMEQTAAVASEG